MDENRKKLYDQLSAQWDMGTFDEFDTDLDNEDNQKVAWQALGGQDGYGDFDLFKQAIQRSPMQPEQQPTMPAGTPTAETALPEPPQPSTPKDQPAEDTEIINQPTDEATTAPTTLAEETVETETVEPVRYDFTGKDTDGAIEMINSLEDDNKRFDAYYDYSEQNMRSGQQKAAAAVTTAKPMQQDMTAPSWSGRYNTLIKDVSDGTGGTTSPLKRGMEQHYDRYNQNIEQARGMTDEGLRSRIDQLMTADYGRDGDALRAIDVVPLVEELMARQNGGHAQTVGERIAEEYLSSHPELADEYRKWQRSETGYDSNTFEATPLTLIDMVKKEIERRVKVADRLDQQRNIIPTDPVTERSNAVSRGVDITSAYNITDALRSAERVYGTNRFESYVVAFAAKHNMTVAQARERVRELVTMSVAQDIIGALEPGSNTEYVLRKALTDNMVMNLARAGMTLASGTKPGDVGLFSMEDKAMEQYERTHTSGWDQFMQVVATTGSFVTEGLGGGGFIAPGILGKSVSDVAMKALSRAGGGLFWKRLVAGSLGGAANFGAFESQMEAVRQLKTGERNADAVWHSLASGLAKGAGFGAVGESIGRLFWHSRGWMVPVGEVVKLAGETATFSAIGYLETGQLTAKDWATNFGMALGGKLTHPVQYIADVKKRMDGGYAPKVQSISDAYSDELSQKGYGTLAKVLHDGVLAKEDIGRVRDELSRMRTDNDVPMQTLQLAEFALNGRVLPCAPATGYRSTHQADGTWTLTPLDPSGRPLGESITVKGTEAKNAAERELKRQIEKNAVTLSEHSSRGADVTRAVGKAVMSYCDTTGEDPTAVYSVYQEALRKSGNKESLGEVERQILDAVGRRLDNTTSLDNGIESYKRTSREAGYDIDKILDKPSGERTAGERKALDEYKTWLGDREEQAHSDNIADFADWVQRSDEAAAANSARIAREYEQKAEGLRAHIDELRGSMDMGNVVVLENIDQVENYNVRHQIEQSERKGERGVPGWYDESTDTTYVYLPHAESIEDLDRTIMHEQVTHHGLRVLKTQGYNDLCDRVWNSMSDAERSRWENYAGVRDIEDQTQRQRAAADEYIAHLAERTDPESAGLWSRFVAWAKEGMRKLGIRTDRISDAELEQLIRESYRNLRNKGERVEPSDEGEVRQDNEAPLNPEGEAPHEEIAEPPAEEAVAPTETVETPTDGDGTGPVDTGGDELPVRSAAAQTEGTAADTHDIRELWPNDFGDITDESLDMYLEAAEQSRKQAHDYANGEAERPDENVWRYWASRDGLTDPAERQAEPAATEPIAEETPTQEPVEVLRGEFSEQIGKSQHTIELDDTSVDDGELELTGRVKVDGEDSNVVLVHGEGDTPDSHWNYASVTLPGENYEELGRLADEFNRIKGRDVAREDSDASRLNFTYIDDAIEFDRWVRERDQEPSAVSDSTTGGSYKLSDEVDENGRQFVLAPNGQLPFGNIGQETGLTPAPILLSEGMITNPVTKDGYGLVHIEARHGGQIRKAGYSSVIEFIEDVAKNYEVIRRGKERDGIQTYMLQLTDKHNNTLMVELSGDGTYWNINTAGIFKTSYGAKRDVVYDRHTTAKQSAETTGASLSGEQSGTTPSTSMGAPTQQSGGKDTTEIPPVQENGQKKLPRGANAEATTIDPKDLPESGHIANMADAWGEVTRVEVVGQNADGTTRVKVWFKNRPNQRGIDVNVDMGGSPQPPEPPTTPPTEPTGSGETLEQRMERERDEWDRQQEEDLRDQQEVDEQMRRNDVAATEGAGDVVDADYADLIADAQSRLNDPNASEFEKQAARTVLRMRSRDRGAADGTDGGELREESDVRYRLRGDEERRNSDESKKLFDAAKAKFGVTNDIREAGYILPDGSMLDFSGRHELMGADDSFLRGTRNSDHRDISDVSFVYDQEGNEVETGMTTDMADFIGRGAIRIDNNAGSINLSMAPTREQETVLRRLIANNDGNVWVDFGDGNNTDHYAEYNDAKATRVLGDIDRYFSEGIKPEGNLRFRAREEAQQYDEQNGTELSRFVDFLERGRRLLDGESRYFHVGNTGELLNRYGIAGKITASASTVNNRHTSDSDHLTAEEWVKTLQHINNPLAITRYGQREKSYRIYTVVQKNGKNICAGVDVKTVGNGVEITNITTAFARDIEHSFNEPLVYPESYDKLKEAIQEHSLGHNPQVYPEQPLSGSKGSDNISHDQADGGETTGNRVNFRLRGDASGGTADHAAAVEEARRRLESGDASEFEKTAARAVIKAYGGGDDTPGGGVRFRTRDDADALVDMAKHNNELARQARDAVVDFVKAITEPDELTDSKFATALGKVMRGQRAYDQATVTDITDMVKAMMDAGLLTELDNFAVKQILTKVKDSTGKNDITGEANKLIDIMLKNQLRRGKRAFEQQLKVKGMKQDSRGVVVQGGLDYHGQRAAKALKEGLSLGDLDTVNDRIAEAEQRLTDPDEIVRGNAADELDGLYIARQYYDEVKQSELNEANVKAQLEQAQTDHKNGTMTDEAYRQFRQACNDALRELRCERVDAWSRLTQALGDQQGASAERAKQFREQQKQRQEEIQHWANSDMEGHSADPHERETRKKTAGDTLRDWGQAVLNPLGTFSQLMRYFGQAFPKGEGYLFNFVRRFMNLRDQWFKERKADFDQMDTAARRIAAAHGARVKAKLKDGTIVPHAIRDWADVYTYIRQQPKLTVTVKGNDYQITQGNAAYLLAMEAQTDGRMKLRAMGLTEADMDTLRGQVDPMLLELSHWVVNDLLPGMRPRLNQTHIRMFGADMTDIPNYFPIRTSELSRNETVNLAQQGGKIRPATITGSVVERKRNNLDLDLSADLFQVTAEHIDEMNHWNNFAEYARDLNTLLSYKRFRAQVNNLHSWRYGNGSDIWQTLEATAAITTGDYQAKTSKADAVINGASQGLAAANITYRWYTGLKQLLSSPVYLIQARWDDLGYALSNPKGTWDWAIKNLPTFAERWQGRMAGDPILTQAEAERGTQNKKLRAASKWGFAFNAAVDAMTVAAGARAIYRTKYRRYKAQGYTEEQSKQKALEDASISVNETQQSGLGAFTSVVQQDRTLWSRIVTLYRNASMGYGRQLANGLKAMRNGMSQEWRAAAREKVQKKLERDGIDPAMSAKVADRLVNRETTRGLAVAAMFGSIAPFVWSLGSQYLGYKMAGGDDDETESKMLGQSSYHLASGWLEGIIGGATISSLADFAYDYYHGRKKLRDYSLQHDLLSDMAEQIIGKSSGKPADAAYDIVNMLVAMGTGVNPKSIVEPTVGIIDVVQNWNGDAALAHEIALGWCRLLNVPQTSLDQVYIDEIGLTAKDAKELTAEQFAERWCRYKRRRGAGYMSPLTSEESDKEQEQKLLRRYERMMDERFESLSDERVESILRDSDDELLKKHATKAHKSRIAALTDDDVAAAVVPLSESAPQDSVDTKREGIKRAYKSEGLSYDTPSGREKNAQAYERRATMTDIAEDAALKGRRDALKKSVGDEFEKMGAEYKKGSRGWGWYIPDAAKSRADEIHAYKQAHEAELEEYGILLRWFGSSKESSGHIKKGFTDGKHSADEVMQEYREARKRVLSKTTQQ